MIKEAAAPLLECCKNFNLELLLNFKKICLMLCGVVLTVLL